MSIDYYGNLKKVVDYYNAYPKNISNPRVFHPVTPTMFDDSPNDKLNNGDFVYDKNSNTFAIVTGSGQGRVMLSIISPTVQNELQQIGSYYPNDLSNFYKVIHRTSGGVIMKKSRKSRKTRKSKKSRKSRKARKM
jgi:hypothetical protein